MWTGRRRHDGSARGGQTRQPGGVPLHHDNDGGIETHQQPGRRRLDAAGLGLRAPEVPHRQVRHLFFLKKISFVLTSIGLERVKWVILG